MAIAPTIKAFLEHTGVSYEELSHPRAENPVQAADAAYADREAVLRALPLKDRRGLLLAIFPITHRLDLGTLNRQLGRDLKLASAEDVRRVFPDCEPGTIPTLGEPYGVRAIRNPAVEQSSQVYFGAGSHSALVKVSGKDLGRLLRSAWRGQDFSQPDPALAPSDLQRQSTTRQRLKDRIKHLDNLPAMPEMAARILQLRANPYAGVRDLARVLELDPSLSAQILRYAQSPFFGYRVPIASIQDAINRVLGYDMVMNVALGIAAGRSFRNPADGPLGLYAFWRHATYTAALVQNLGKILPPDRQPRPGLAYLAGLLHNFGYLLLGHLFQPEFYWLNKAVAERPDQPITDIEQEMLGVTHMELGTWLMESWRMPGEVVAAIQAHHDPEYRDVHAVYANLVLLAIRLLKRHDIGDACSLELPAHMLEQLGLKETQAVMALDTILQGQQALDMIARQLAA